MKSIAYYNGQTGSPEELAVPFNDRSHFFGDGVYDAAMGANGKIFLLEDHLDRFYSSATSFRIKVPMERDELAALLLDLLSQVDGASQFVYWQVTRGISGERGHLFDPETPGILWVLINQEPMADPQKPLKLITLPDTRFEHCNVKTLNLLPAVMASQAASEAGADEAIPVIERPFTLDELFDADEVIVTASSTLCSIAREIDGEPVGGHDPATIRALLDIVFREYFDYCGLKKLN